MGTRKFVFLLTLGQSLSAGWKLSLVVRSEVGTKDGVDTLVWLDEGRPGFPGSLRNSIALAKGEDLLTLFILVAGYICHYIVSIDCHFFGSHLHKFVSLFR